MPARLWFAHRSNHQGATKVYGRFCANVFDAAAPICSEVIIAQAIALRVDDLLQSMLQHGPLRRFNLYLEDRELDTLTEVLAGFRHSPQPAGSTRIGGAHVIGHEYHHCLHSLPEPGRVGIEITAKVASQ